MNRSLAVSSATPAWSRDYYVFLLHLCENAKRRIHAVIFLVDPRIDRDPERSVRRLIDALAYARWRGVDVRILVASSDRTADIFVANLTAARLLRRRGVPVRLYPTRGNGSTHSKYALFDHDQLLLGSHNWTDQAFNHGIESSILIESEGMVQDLSEEFEQLWGQAEEVPPDED